MNKLSQELTSSLLSKYILIINEISRLGLLMTHYNNAGNQSKLEQVLNAIKRLELSKNAVGFEIDKRIKIPTKQEEQDEQADGDSTPA